MIIAFDYFKKIEKENDQLMRLSYVLNDKQSRYYH